MAVTGSDNQGLNPLHVIIKVRGILGRPLHRHHLPGQGLHERQLSRKLKTVTAQYYRTLLREARDKGLIASDVDEFTAAFCIDNILVMLQYAYSSEYFSERMRIFAGDDALTNDEKMIQGTMRFIRRALTGREA